MTAYMRAFKAKSLADAASCAIVCRQNGTGTMGKRIMRGILTIAVLVLFGFGLAVESAASVTAKVGSETTLYAAEMPVVGTIRAGEFVGILGESGGWYKIRFKAASGEFVNGLVSASAFTKSKPNLAGALRDTPVYATTRPSLATIPAGTEVELLRFEGKTCVVRHFLLDGQSLEGVVMLDAIAEISAVREEMAKAAVLKEKAEAEARMAEAFSQMWTHKYALVDGEYVRLPDFDLRYQNSRGGEPFPGGSGKPTLRLSPNPMGKFMDMSQWRDAQERRDRDVARWKERVAEWEKDVAKSKRNWKTDLPGWAVGEFGYTRLSNLEVFQVQSPTTMLVRVGRPGTSRVVYFTGWATKDLVDEQTIKETHVAIIGAYTYDTVMGSMTVLRAIPLAQVQRGLTQEQFKELLKQKQGNLE